MSKKGDRTVEENAIIDRDFTAVMKEGTYIYTLETVKNRALPDIRDGVLPVQRNLIYGMFYANNTADKIRAKSARSVGLVMGLFHPHGNMSLYGAMVKLAQDFKVGPSKLIDMSGNIGTLSGSRKPAADRYTETRLSKVAKLTYMDLNFETVNMIPNFDGTLKQPEVLPTRIPLLLIQGAEGIAKAYSSKFLPHNYHDSIRLCKEFNNNRQMTIDEMIKIIKAPDIPSGGSINGLESVIKAYKTGRGSALVRGDIETSVNKRGRDVLTITTLPPSVTTETFKASMTKLLEKKMLKISEFRDLSDKHGIKLVITLKKDEDVERVRNLLYKKAGVQATESMTMNALINDVPVQVDLKTIVSEFIKFREDVVYKRSLCLKKRAEDKLHISRGLEIAYNNLDAIIAIIRDKRKTEAQVKASLMKKYKLSDIQAEYILDLKLRRLSNLRVQLVMEDIKRLTKEIGRLTIITKSKQNKHITNIINEELDEALTYIEDTGRSSKIMKKKEIVTEIDSIKDENRILTLSINGRMKIMDFDPKVQGRNGRGSSFTTINDDPNKLVINTSTTSELLCFTNKGRVFSEFVYKLDTSGKNAKGRLAKSIFSLRDGEELIYVQSIKRDTDTSDLSLCFVTKLGAIKLTKYEEYENIPSNGKIAISMVKDDMLVSVKLCNPKKEDVLIVTNDYGIRFKLANVTHTGRNSKGVKAMKLKAPYHRVVGAGLISAEEDKFVYMIDENGNIKKVISSDFKNQSRGGYGVIIGSKIRSMFVEDVQLHNLSILTEMGTLISIEKSSVRKTSRTAKGVKGIKLAKGDSVIKIFDI